ncbi:uncharacterized protein K452DRAFT_327102 [Aplosporella prunicola CBS 121167]|uniref:Altered inheritance of mitochondria protein 41 n=1 Tax=Aplosporella prunicola CBS 121167 TaxID=1176127 RepID=A0A6A6BBJ1_9PEZI|nr:uncharacterized protein K452DRAFT_327102 [Aplosporella prunicola CBS 121167]KAF2141416.1 hypothetical protein K452DRAFT_327102 [Aplosporella prunicola CBS 121167]
MLASPFRQPARVCLRCLRTSRAFLRFSSTDGASSSPILSRLREDMKAAMRSKDQPTLAVVRSLLADITNLSKTASPIANDTHLRSLLLKKTSQAQAAAQEFRDAKREDLATKEDTSVQIMQRYVGEIEEVGGLVKDEEVKEVVQKTLAEWSEGKKDFGSVMKKVLGVFEGKMVEKSDVAKAVKDALASK